MNNSEAPEVEPGEWILKAFGPESHEHVSPSADRQASTPVSFETPRGERPRMAEMSTVTSDDPAQTK